MAEEGDRQISGFAPDEVICMLGHAALMRFTEDMNTCRELLHLARERDRQSDRPRSLQSLGRDLDPQQRRSVEQVVATLPDGLVNTLERRESSPGEVVVEGKRHPYSREQLIVGAILEIGRGEYETLLAPLADVCRGKETALAYALAYLRWRQRRGADRLARAVVPMAVSGFESFFSDILRTWYLVHQERLRESKAKIDLGTLFSYASLDDQRRAGIDIRIGELLDVQAADWQKHLRQDGLELNVQGLGGDWNRFQEVLARRNAIVHNDDRVDDRYLQRTPWLVPAPEKGELLDTDEVYALRAMVELQVKAESVTIAVLTDLVPGSKDLGSLVTNLTFDALRDERWADALLLASTFLDEQAADHAFHEARINRWMAARKMGQQIGPEVEAWCPPTGDSLVALGLAALLGREQDTLIALRRCEEDRSDMRRLVEWPLLVDFGRRNARVEQALLRYRSNRSAPPRQRRQRKRR